MICHLGDDNDDAGDLVQDDDNDNGNDNDDDDDDDIAAAVLNVRCWVSSPLGRCNPLNSSLCSWGRSSSP